MYQDRTLTCRDCSGEFVFSSGEQAFFATKGLQNDPQRCPSCRSAAKQARTAGGPREFHAAICAACGGQAMVPFAPRVDRPVYCSSCFDKVRAGTLGNDASAGVKAVPETVPTPESELPPILPPSPTPSGGSG